MNKVINFSDPINDIQSSTNKHISFNTLSKDMSVFFNKISDLSFRHLGSRTCLIATRDDPFVLQVVKIASWVFLITPLIFTSIYLYDLLTDLYHQYVDEYAILDKDVTSETLMQINSLDLPNQEFLIKDFEMVDPIIIDYTNKIVENIDLDPIENQYVLNYFDDMIANPNISISQIKLDLPRINLSVNNNSCLTIEDFTNALNISLNKDKTNIIETGNTNIPLLLAFSQQRILTSAENTLSSYFSRKHKNSFILSPLSIPRAFINIDTNYSQYYPDIKAEKCFKIFNINDSGHAEPLPYLLRAKINYFFGKMEISWEVKEEPLIESKDVETDTFEELEDFSNAVDSNINYNKNIAINHLINNTSSCLTSTVTLEYLTFLQKKYPHFTYTPRLMLSVPINIDEIASELNILKNSTNSNSLLFLPFLVKGSFVNHAVVAVINLSTQTIEYFDPKGQSYIYNERREIQSNEKVFDFLTEIGKKVISPTFSKENILYNKKNTPQGFFDNINCGAFSLQFIEERITHSFDQIENGIPGKIKDALKLRSYLAQHLI